MRTVVIARPQVSSMCLWWPTNGPQAPIPGRPAGLAPGAGVFVRPGVRKSNTESGIVTWTFERGGRDITCREELAYPRCP